jgi:hypothetical protein
MSNLKQVQAGSSIVPNEQNETPVKGKNNVVKRSRKYNLIARKQYEELEKENHEIRQFLAENGLWFDFYTFQQLPKIVEPKLVIEIEHQVNAVDYFETELVAFMSYVRDLKSAVDECIENASFLTSGILNYREVLLEGKNGKGENITNPLNV